MQSNIKLYETTLCVAFNKAIPPSEVARWQHQLQKLHAEGTADKIFDRYMQK